MDLLPMLAAASGAGGETDDDFANTVLLLHGDGTNGAQNNTFLDSSTNNFTITRAGNTTQGSFSPFSKPDGRWGNYFGSTSANLKFASNAAFAIGTGNFTVECFVNFDAWASTNQRILMQDVSGGSNLQIGRDSGANNLFVVIAGSTVINYSWSPSVGQFYHIAIVRSGTGTNEVALYIDGVSVATGTSNGSISQQQVIVGGLDWATGYNIQGYISNFRYSNIARTIAVPTAPYSSDANTLILTCQSNRFIDNSANAFAITRNGDVKVTPFSPFPITTAYDPSVNGGSGYFDGSGDYIQLADNAALELASESNWTVEFWGYFVSTPSDFDVILGKGTGSGSYEYFFEAFSDNTIDILYSADGTTTWTGQHQITPAIPNGQWFHLAAVRNGATFKSYVNGVEYFSGSSFNIYAGSGVLNIGGFSGSATQDPNMYISGLRIVKGSSVYTSNFTIPSAPPTAIANTSLLCNFTNAGIFDNTGFNNLETVGNAQIDTTTKKYGTGSMEFDGTGDWLQTPSSTEFGFGTGDFTIEGWFNFVSHADFRVLVDFRTSANQVVPTIYTNASGHLFYFVDGSNRISDTTGLSTGVFIHIAVARSGTSTKMFVNGTQVGSTWTDTANYIAGPLRLGTNFDNTTPFNGFIDDLRITKGVARYLTTFTPPTKAFPDIGS